MSKRQCLASVAAAAILLATGGVAQAVPTLTNPSFETGTFPTFPGYVSNNMPIAGWAVGGATNRVGVNIQSGPFASNLPIPSGVQTGFVQNAIGATGTLSTEITGLTPGEQYTVSFRYNARTQANPADRPLLESTLGDYRGLVRVLPTAAGYYRDDFSFVADSDTATLSFANVNNGPDTTALIDDIQVTEGAPAISSIGVRASSNLAGGFNRNARFLVDGSGLDVNGPGTHTVVPDGFMWLTTGVFQAPNDTDPEVVFDLGAPHDIQDIRIWNYNEQTNNLTSRGVAAFDLLVADDADGPFTLVGSHNLTRAPGVNNVDFSETFDINTRARFVKIDPLSSHGGDNAFVGLSEVQFNGQVVQGRNALIKGVTIADVSSNLAGFNRQARFLVDSSGLFNDTHTLTPDGFMWLNQGTFGGGSDLAPEITFDLGQLTAISEVKVWNYNENLPGRPELLGRGVSQMEILVADELDGTFESLGIYDLRMAPGVDFFDFGEIIELDTTARYVRFDILGNHGGDNNFVGLSEVQFFGQALAQGVPEPTTGTLLLLAGAGVMIRRRRAAA